VASPPAVPELTAEAFADRLLAHASPDERDNLQRHFKMAPGAYGEGDMFAGVRMRDVFALAKEFIDMSAGEIERLLESPVHEVRAGALSIMDKAARRKRTPDDRRKELFDLYLGRMDRIDNWDLVDLAAPYVVGGYLFDKPRDVLFDLARSSNVWERRTAMISTLYFARQGDLDDIYRIAEILLHDDHDLIHKAVGGMLREAGKHDRPRLLAFLDERAATMPRTMLRYAIEHLDEAQRAHYRGAGRQV
jgi:3-methyladenine DNA glycosylase AlkD